MLANKWGTLALGSFLVLALSVGCSDDDSSGGSTGGSGGKAGSGNAGSNNTAGSNSQAGKGGSSGQAGSAGSGGKPLEPTAGAGGADDVGGQAGATFGGAGGEGPQGGQGGEASAQGGEGGGSDALASCDSVRAGLLGPIASVSTGLVTVTSAQNAVKVTVVVDASAGGFAAAANNPYIYVSLANKARVDVTDVQADASTAWDIALKRDNIRSNSGDSGPGAAQVAALAAASFDATTAAAATTADFGHDAFIDAATCDTEVDGTGKPVTAFDGWYDYAPATMTLSPADKVFLVRAANGTSLYKLKIDAYYADVSDGQGGTVKKSAVYTLTYQAL